MGAALRLALLPTVFVPVLLALCGCDQRPPPRTEKVYLPSAPVRPPEVGRFTIIHSPQTEQDTMLIDTVTGETWELDAMVSLKGDPRAWIPVPRLNTAQDYAALERQHGLKSK
jgi:hypothetical protein